MLVTDIDNTLLNSKSEITPEVKDAVAYARGKGIEVILSSGRCYIAMLMFEKELGLLTETQLGISFNGGLIYESLSQKALTDYRLDREVAFEIIQGLKSNGASVLVYQGGDLYAEDKTPDVMDYWHRSFLPITILDDFHQLSGDLSKIIIRGEKSFLESLERAVRELAFGRCCTFFSADTLLEYCPLEATKGVGLEKVCGFLGISPAQTIAAGDQNNDISMLRAAGLGVAVANATNETKAAADLVMEETNDQHAIARIIYKYFS